MQTYDLKTYGKYLPHKSVTEPSKMVCVAWKWLGDNHVSSTSVLNDAERFKADPHDDYYVTKVLHALLDSASIAVAHNGDNFDIKSFNARAIYHGFDPIKKVVTIDTLKEARKLLKVESCSLSYLCRMFGIANKDESPDWQKVWESDRSAILECERYCRQDIRALEALYLTLRPWIRNHPNMGLYTPDLPPLTCPICNNHELRTNGTYSTKTGVFQRYRCDKDYGGCGATFRAKKNLAIKPDLTL